MTEPLSNWKDIPVEFKEGNTKWNKLFTKIFYYEEAPGTIETLEGIVPPKGWETYSCHNEIL